MAIRVWFRLLLLISLLLLLLFGCSSLSQSGYIRVETYPRHNEDIFQNQAITKWKGELKENVRYRFLGIELNPKVYLVNSWPDGVYTYGWGGSILESNLVLRGYLTRDLALFFAKKNYYEVTNNLNMRICNCTYANSIGVEYQW